jgi:hypothetical protein
LNYFGMSRISVGVRGAVKFQLNYSRKAGEGRRRSGENMIFGCRVGDARRGQETTRQL